ncbi:ribosomal protein S12 methylthiotransferase RimO [Eubacterium nodatum ATCC 33099]|nr:ribosomal protein S12 methylthiotransferase RimO [Eubacterium nodatum ATCC 33099]
MKVYFNTLGCPKNINDSEIAMGNLEEKGFTIVESPDEADAIIVNTCGFIEDAKKESIDEIFNMAAYKEKNKKLVISGCLVQRYADELYKEIPEANGFIGVNDYDKLPKLLEELEKSNERFLENSSCDLSEVEVKIRHLTENPYTSYLKIAEGCDNICSYCIIPEIRGPYRSRTIENVIEEAEMLSKSGCKELILIAQDLTYYGIDNYGKPMLSTLLRKLCKIEGIEWIRLLYCYEERIDDELIRTIASEDKICNYIDIPIQHASDKILDNMNRATTNKSLYRTLSKLRSQIPDIHIRTTLIVGFPGETEEDFNILSDFVSDQKFSRLGVFTYSREEGTAAATMDNQIPEDIKQERLDCIMMKQMEISLEGNRKKIGKTLDVIVDSMEEEGVYSGRTRYDAPEIDNSVVFTSNSVHKPGDIVPVEILEAYDYDLEGREV